MRSAQEEVTQQERELARRVAAKYPPGTEVSLQ